MSATARLTMGAQAEPQTPARPYCHPVPTREEGDMPMHADELTVVHHDDTKSHFTDVTYTLSREGLRVVTAAGDETAFAGHDVLTVHAHRRHDGLAA
ncbi:hypothetical protein [Actinoplanes sp. N902-109]|uniref:hypothetical protein n=1 Tax=Actinoplanes sp. (strain N902-109) TaxID=649831 RepID=UPI0003294F01|nr:hypothetical protein [Actinoplanes sp. N902-109]AGL18465.1 hypothetical protein L083_4955 [Actinoplanes sp. N902-109]